MSQQGGLGALSVPAFRLYFVGAVAAVNANWVFRIILTWVAWDMTRSASFVGLVAALSLLPVAIVGPLFGVLADRADIKRAYMRVSIALLTCPLLFILFYGAGALEPWSLLGLATAFGIALSAHHPVRQSLGPRLVPSEQVGSVVALAALNFNVGRVLAPSVGGLLIGQVGVIAASTVAAILFLPSLFIAPHLTPRSHTANSPRARFLDDLKEGFRSVLGQANLRLVLLLTIVALGPIRALSELLALVADGTFARGAEGLGIMTSAVGAGALIAALIQVSPPRWLQSNASPWRVIIPVGFLSGLAVVLSPTFGLALTALPVLGFCATFIGVSLQIVMQAQLEDRLRGRIMSLWMLATTLATSCLALMISIASEYVGLAAAVIGVFAVCAVLAFWFVQRRRAINHS